MKKRILCLFLLIIFAMSAFACTEGNTTDTSSSGSPDNTTSADNNSSVVDITEETSEESDDGYVDSGEIKIRCFKVGKADATIIRTKNHVLLIDTASDDKGTKIVEYLNEKGIEKIDYLIVTHFDKSEVGGADAILRLVKTENIIQPNYVKDSVQYREFMNEAKLSGATITTLTESMTLEFDGATFHIYPAMQSTYLEDSDNNYSIGVTIVHGENSFLFPGDAMSARMKEIMDYNTNTLGISEFTFLKAPCNGAYCEGTYGIDTQAFAEWAKPIYVSVSCSEKNPAEEKAVEIYTNAGAKIYYTMNGNIKMTSDGESLDIVQ